METVYIKESRDRLYETIEYMVQKCKRTEHTSDLYSSMMDNFNSVNKNAQMVKQAICKNGEEGENITDFELEEIEKSFSEMVASIFDSYDCLMKNLPNVSEDFMIKKLADRLTNLLEDRRK